MEVGGVGLGAMRTEKALCHDIDLATVTLEVGGPENDRPLQVDVSDRAHDDHCRLIGIADDAGVEIDLAVADGTGPQIAIRAGNVMGAPHLGGLESAGTDLCLRIPD